MTFTRKSLTCAVFTLCLGLFAAGCSDRSSRSGNTAPPSGTASAPPSGPSGTPTSGGNGPTPGTVGNLTGDPDTEVSATLQQQVAAGLAKGDEDDPVDF